MQPPSIGNRGSHPFGLRSRFPIGSINMPIVLSVVFVVTWDDVLVNIGRRWPADMVAKSFYPGRTELFGC